MSRIWQLVIAAFVVFVATLGTAHAEEVIHAFHADLALAQDGSMTVVEKIQVRSEGQQIKRGIFRDFPTQYQDSQGGNVSIGFKILGIFRDGQPEPWHTQTIEGGTRIYIGDADVLLPHGQHAYEIHYKTARHIGFYTDFDELYWNVTGNGWAFPIETASARLILPAQTPLPKIDGFTGARSSTARNMRLITEGNQIVWQTTEKLQAGEGLTILAQLPKGVVQQPSVLAVVFWKLADNKATALSLLLLLAATALFVVLWHRHGRDPEVGPVIPLFAPPADLNPAACRYVWLQGGVDATSFAALLVNCARKGYCRIVQKEDNDSLRLVRSASDKSVLDALEQKTCASLFPGNEEGSTFVFSGDENRDRAAEAKILEASEKIKSFLDQTLEKPILGNYPKLSWLPVVLSILAAAAAIFSLPNTGPLGAALLISLASGIPLGILSVRIVKRESFAALMAWAVTGVAAIIIALMTGPSIIAVHVGISLYAIALTSFFSHLLKKPTLAGAQIRNGVLGFRMFLGTTEQDRLNALHPPEQTPELFEKFLPYAMALDVENEWGERFSAVLAQLAAEGTPYQPDWIIGDQRKAFHLQHLHKTLENRISQSIASATQSSAGGGSFSSSSSSGGGSSGGGRGGGGGGGW